MSSSPAPPAGEATAPPPASAPAPAPAAPAPATATAATAAAAAPAPAAPAAHAPSPAAPIDHDDDEPPVPPTSWPASCPSEDEDHIVSVVCGNSHLHWAFHHGIKSDVNPALFWRTPPLNAEDLSGSLPEALSRHLPQFAHDYIFGPGAPADSASAIARSKSRSVDKIAVYVISTNSDQVKMIAKLWRSIPCRMYLLRGDDFFSLREGRYESMGVDRLATLRGAAEIHGFPALVFDGGTATTYTAADSDGRIMGGGIGPGLHVKFRSLNDYTDALPHVSPDEVLAAVRDAVHTGRPLPAFGNDTKEAIMVDVLSELAVKGRSVIQHWLDRVGEKPGSNEEKKTSEGSAIGKLRRNLKSNDERAVLVTGGDGEILTQLFQPDHANIVDLGSSYAPLEGRRYQIMHAKHLIHYGISSAIMRQVERRRRAGRRQKAGEEADRRNEKFIGQRVAKRFDQPDAEGEYVYRGAVRGVERGKDDDEDFFLVVYDDGDKESVDLEGLQDMIKLYGDVGEKEPASSSKRKQTAAPASAAKAKAAPQAKMPVPGSAAAAAAEAPTSAAKGKKRKPAEEPTTAAGAPPKRAKTPGKKQVEEKPTEAGTPASAAASKEKPEEYVGVRVAKDFDGEIYYGRVTEYERDAEGVEGGLWHVVYDDGDEEDFERKELRRSLKLYERNRADDPNPKRGGRGRK